MSVGNPIPLPDALPLPPGILASTDPFNLKTRRGDSDTPARVVLPGDPEFGVRQPVPAYDQKTTGCTPCHKGTNGVSLPIAEWRITGLQSFSR